MLSLEQGQQEIQNLMDTVMLYQHRKPLFTRLGRAVLTDARLNFRRQQAPDGTPWAPLKIRTGQILSDTGRLRNSLSYKTGNDEVEVGTNVKYAAVHNFGATIRPKKAKMLAFPGKNGKTIFAKKVVIPARPFLGIEQRQINLVQQTIEQWVKDVANRNV
ncbi:phage virion morphogenesis protein [Endozoicomonas atrinae]|uniref:phage virion morphogenesis protein n=1 Tax=Endozoicomonas atrinae TaxID=1333660 RepID=UPI003AFFBC9C